MEKIRNIHIYEADYNLILKLKWEQAIALSEKHNLLHSSQYGSRQQRRSIDPVLLEIILQETSRFTRTPFIQINYDAQACYDRIIPDIAFAISRKHGVHHKIIQMVQETMKSSKCYIKLRSHVTSQFYCNKETTQLYGTGQGSGCSPHIWTMLSSELFHIYMENAHGFDQTDPYGNQSTSLL
jgi:Reverse transcriptase (RNA-dependent DNA polymerase)